MEVTRSDPRDDLRLLGDREKRERKSRPRRRRKLQDTRGGNTGPPSINRESVSGITEHDATLEAQIETHGLYTGY